MFNVIGKSSDDRPVCMNYAGELKINQFFAVLCRTEIFTKNEKKTGFFKFSAMINSDGSLTTCTWRGNYERFTDTLLRLTKPLHDRDRGWRNDSYIAGKTGEMVAALVRRGWQQSGRKTGRLSQKNGDCPETGVVDRRLPAADFHSDRVDGTRRLSVSAGRPHPQNHKRWRNGRGLFWYRCCLPLTGLRAKSAPAA